MLLTPPSTAWLPPTPPFASDFGKLPSQDRSPPSRQDGKCYCCRPPCVYWSASIFVSDFGKLPPYDRSPPSRQDGKSFTAVCRPPCVSWFASISIEAVRQVVAVKVDALWSSPPRSPRWSSPPWFPRWSSVRLDCAPPWSYRLRGLPMAVLFVEGCRRGCATSASASAVSSRLLLSGREQVRDNELSWVSASQPGSRWTHRIF